MKHIAYKLNSLQFLPVDAVPHVTAQGVMKGGEREGVNVKSGDLAGQICEPKRPKEE